MNVPKRCLGTQTRPDRLRGEPRQGEVFHALTPLALTRTDFSEISSQKSQILQRFIVANAMHGPHSPMNVPKRCLGTQTRPDRLRGEPRQGEVFRVLTPLALTRTD